MQHERLAEEKRESLDHQEGPEEMLSCKLKHVATFIFSSVHDAKMMLSNAKHGCTYSCKKYLCKIKLPLSPKALLFRPSYFLGLCGIVGFGMQYLDFQ